MTKDEFQRKYWRYYLILEEDFLKTIRFVELDINNFNTYSVEYTKQYQSICSEVDVICKSICKYIDNNSTANKFPQYVQTILNYSTDITKRIIKVDKNEDILLQPFENLTIVDDYKPLDWWQSYNSIKHNRLHNYKMANLKNILNALGALYILESYFCEIIVKDKNDNKNTDEKLIENIPDIPSKIFEFSNWESNEDDIMDDLIMRLQ